AAFPSSLRSTNPWRWGDRARASTLAPPSPQDTSHSRVRPASAGFAARAFAAALLTGQWSRFRCLNRARFREAGSARTAPAGTFRFCLAPRSRVVRLENAPDASAARLDVPNGLRRDHLADVLEPGQLLAPDRVPEAEDVVPLLVAVAFGRRQEQPARAE